MSTEVLTPLQAAESALLAAEAALENYRRHQMAERQSYEGRLRGLTDLTEQLRAENPKAKKLPLQEGERTGYNMTNRLLEEALRECTPMEKGFVKEFWQLIQRMYGPAGQ